jgi:hypothetical protein
MLKVVLTITQTLISIYWAGGMARQNSAIDEVIELVEEGYMLFNSKIKNSSVSIALKQLNRFYILLFWVSFGMLLFIPFFGQLFISLKSSYFILSCLFLFSGFSWSSISWCTEHKEVLKNLTPMIVMFILAPFLISLLYLLEPSVGNPIAITLAIK